MTVRTGGIYLLKTVCFNIYVCLFCNTQSLNRMLVKVKSAVFSIPELELVIPAWTQRGQVTTVESVLTRTIENLQQDQSYRMVSQRPHDSQYCSTEGRGGERKNGGGGGGGNTWCGDGG